jgi:uncharacterized membrane protein YkvA (DUF1232 family)
MSRTDEIRQVIARNKGEGAVRIAEFMTTKFGANSAPEDLADHIDFCHQVIEAVPKVIDNARAEAQRRGFDNWVEPLLKHAEEYFLNPRDLLPEAYFGELGLLDDAYLAYRIIDLVRSDPPLLQVDMQVPIDFITQVLGEEAVASLESEVEKAQAGMHAHMRRLQEAARRAAEAERARRRQPRQAGPARASAFRPEVRPGRQQCGACAGSGRVTCSSCYGHGYHTQSSSRIDWEGNVEYVTEEIPCGCSGGYTTCPDCGGAGWR